MYIYIIQKKKERETKANDTRQKEKKAYIIIYISYILSIYRIHTKEGKKASVKTKKYDVDQKIWSHVCISIICIYKYIYVYTKKKKKKRTVSLPN